MKKKTDSEKIDELVEVVGFIKDRMVTKDEFQQECKSVQQEFKNVKEKITAVELNLMNRLDNELDKRGQLETRVMQLEKAQK